MEKTFETALKELEVIIKELESGTIELEQAITKYTEAMGLVKFCSDKLTAATDQVNKTIAENGELQVFEIQDDVKE